MLTFHAHSSYRTSKAPACEGPRRRRAAAARAAHLAYADPIPSISRTKYLLMPVWNLDEGEKLPYVKVLFRGRFPRPEGHLQTLKICAKITPSAAGLCGLPKSKPRES